VPVKVDYYGIASEFRADHLHRWWPDKSNVCMQYRLLLDDLIDRAIQHAQLSALTENEFEYHVLDPIASFVRELTGSFLSDEELSKAHSFWNHRANPLQDIASKKVPNMGRDSLQESARLYLEMPIRHQRVDRLLIDSLTALELYAFGDEMINEPKFLGLPPRSPLRQSHPLWAFIKGQFGNVIGALVLFALALIPYKLGWIGETGLVITGLILCGLVCLFFVIGLVALPSFLKWTRGAGPLEPVR
jgi:hypothetical protein